MRIYTKTGDKGETSLFGGKRVLKSDLKVEAYGSIDELNSMIGVVVSQIQNSKCKVQNYNSKLKSELIDVQRDLLEIGFLLASPTSKSSYKRLHLREGATFMQKRINKLEELIDNLSKELPELKNFILPGGGEIGSLLHFARSIARRSERRVVALSQKEKVLPSIITYLNRLSDLLFVMARFVNYLENQKEITWTKFKKSK